MAKITALPVAGPLLGNEALPIVQGAETRRATLDQFAGMLAEFETAREQIRARALLYGIANLADARLFAAEATELAFADGFYREGYTRRPGINQVTNWFAYGDPAAASGRGLPVFGSTAPMLYRPTEGDATFVVEADVPAHNGALQVLASFVGPVLENRVTVYRNEVGIYALQVYNNEQGLQVAAGPTDLTARRMRVAVTIGAGSVSASFDGRPPITIRAKQPAQLLRLWFGTLAQGNGGVLAGYVTRAAFVPYRVSGALLRSMSGGPVTDDEITQLIDQKITTHDNDDRAHALEVTRRAVELADSKTGLWTVKAADGFTGADGSALGNSEVGAIPWVSASGLVRKGGRVQHPTNGFGGAWLNSGAKDGQVEGDLYAGAGEASLYFRINAATSAFFLLQRNGDGGITLNHISGATTTRLAPLLSVPVVAGERFKVRFIGPRIWVFRVVAGEETLLLDVTNTALVNETIHGVRLNGGGSVDSFRVLAREAI